MPQARACQAAVLVVLLSATASAEALEVRGRAQVQDGDTLKLGSERVRLLDIDAPELGQACQGPKALAACGRLAAEMLETQLAGMSVICRGTERDDYGRLLARCGLGGQDLSTWMVQEGWALAYRPYSTRLVVVEEVARRDRRGLWRTKLQPPWTFRARRWAEGGSTAPGGCAIKGNINRKGERIYHLPWGDRFYGKTKVNERKGERWFCSEREALAAGFRAPLFR